MKKPKDAARVKAAPVADVPLTYNMAQARQLTEILDGLRAVEEVIRKFQGEVAAINTDAAYEVKRAADYFLADCRGGIEDVVSRLETESDYQPDTFAADVLAGRVEDEPLMELEPVEEQAMPKVERGRRNLRGIEDVIVVADCPTAQRGKNAKGGINNEDRQIVH